MWTLLLNTEQPNEPQAMRENGVRDEESSAIDGEDSSNDGRLVICSQSIVESNGSDDDIIILSSQDDEGEFYFVSISFNIWAHILYIF